MSATLFVRKSPEPLWHLTRDLQETVVDTLCGIAAFPWTQSVVPSYLDEYAREEKLGPVRRCMACESEARR